MRKKTIHIVILALLHIYSYASNYTYDASRGVVFQWAINDMVVAFTEDATKLILWEAGFDNTKKDITLDGNGWGLASNTQYYSFFPYDTGASKQHMTAMHIDLCNQMQDGNGNMRHLGKFDFMSAQDKSTDNDICFKYKHHTSIIRFAFKMHSETVVKQMTVHSSGKEFTTTALLDITKGTWLNDLRQNEMNVTFRSTKIEAGDSLIAYLVIMPKDFSDTDFNVTITTDDDNTMTASFKGVNIESGKVYPLALRLKSSANAKSNVATEEEEQQQRAKALHTQETKTIYNPHGHADDFAIDNSLQEANKQLEEDPEGDDNPEGGSGEGDDNPGGGSGEGDDNPGGGSGEGDDNPGGGSGEGDDNPGGGSGEGDDDIHTRIVTTSKCKDASSAIYTINGEKISNAEAKSRKIYIIQGRKILLKR